MTDHTLDLIRSANPHPDQLPPLDRDGVTARVAATPPAPVSRHRPALPEFRSVAVGAVVMATIAAVILVVIPGHRAPAGARRLGTIGAGGQRTLWRTAMLHAVDPAPGLARARGSVSVTGRWRSENVVTLLGSGLPRIEPDAYGVWLVGPGRVQRFIGFYADQPLHGHIAAEFPLPLVDLRQPRTVELTLQRQARPVRPGTVVLRGTLP